MFLSIPVIVVAAILLLGLGAFIGWRECDRQARRQYENTLSPDERAELHGAMDAGQSWREFARIRTEIAKDDAQRWRQVGKVLPSPSLAPQPPLKIFPL